MEQYPLVEEQTQYPTSSRSDNSDTFMMALIEVEEAIQKFEMETLRRQRLKVDLKNKKKQWVAISEGIKPICNELGICEILGRLRSRATVICRLTKKTDDEIMKDMFQFHRSLIELFQLRADDWELDEELAKPLLDSCVELVEDIIFSSRGGFTAMNVRSTYGRQENVSLSSNDNRGVKILGVNVK